MIALRWGVVALLLSGGAAFLSGCTEELETEEDAAEISATTLALRTVKSAATYKAISTQGGGFGQSGRSAKFFIDWRDKKSPQIYFINGNYQAGGKTPDYALYHYDFARHQLNVPEGGGEFNDNTYFTENKRYVAGTLQTYEVDGKVAYGIQLYPDDVAHDEGILEIVKVVTRSFKIKGARVLFVAGGPQQTTRRVTADLAALGVEAKTIEDMLAGVNYMPLNPGEAWGYLRLFPQDLLELRPSDIPVFDELPLDLSVVQGTITQVFQDVTSHVNLKAKERGTPNMVLRDVKTNPAVAALAGKAVHLTVSKDGFKLEASTTAVVEAKMKEKLNRPWIKLPIVKDTRVLDFDAMCTAASSGCLTMGPAYGGKVTGLGFLAHKSVLGRASVSGTLSAKYGYDLPPHGFGIPVDFYRQFVSAPENAALKTKLDDLIVKEKQGSLSPKERAALSDVVQGLFYTGKIPSAQLSAIKTQIAALRAQVPGLEKIKVRSSANAEDIPNFDGAGLHDSFSAEFDEVDNADGSCRVETDGVGVATKLKVKPKTVQCAVKAVFASLWNDRAIEERTFARLDHTTVGMGIAVVPAYDTEAPVASNGVLITRPVNSDFLAYTLSLQKGDNLVTNPEPGTISQMTFSIFGDIGTPPRFTIARHATPVAGGPALKTSVMTDANMTKIIELGKSVEIAYCKAKPGYYTGNCKDVWIDNEKPKSLDMEFKFLTNGHFVMKQVREFHGR